MNEVFEKSTFILAFLILTLFISMTLGEKVLNGFLWLVLASMIVVNVDKFVELVGKGVA